MEDFYANFEAMLTSACARVSPEYFQLPVAEGDDTYRERVYCYELYHQLRQDWDLIPFSLGGEVDKRGHPYFRLGPYALAKPDYLVHRPGSMDDNLVCVEVKPSSASTESLLKDMQKLSWFCSNARYFRGILLIYGEPTEKRPDHDLGGSLRDAADAQAIEHATIRIARHASAGNEAVLL